MEVTTPSTPAPSTPSVAPAPAPVTAPAPAVSAPATPSVQMEDGGFTQTASSGGFFKNLNWIEVGLTTLGVAALLYVIYYHRYKVKQDKMINNELQRQIDEIKMNLQSSMKGKYKTL